MSLIDVIRRDYILKYNSLETNIKDIDTLFKLNKSFNYKWESILQNIITDIYKIVKIEQEKEMDSIMSKIKKELVKKN